MDIADLLGRPELAATRWSVDIRNADDPQRHAPQALLRTASLGKVFLLVEVADRLDRGTLDPEQPLRRDRVAPVADSGLWQHLASPTLPVADAAFLVGAVSDNWATNALLDLVGLAAVQERAHTLAPGGSTLHDLVRDDRGPGHPATLSEGCAADWATVFADLATGTVVGPGVSERVLSWLVTGVDLSMVASGLLLDPLAHTASDQGPGGVRLWNKTGTDSSARADAGVVHGPAGRVSYAAICNWERGDSRPRGAVMAAMRELGNEVARLVGAP